MLPAQAVPPSNANTASTPTSRAIIAESFLPPSAYSRSTRIAPPFPARQSAFSRSAPARVKRQPAAAPPSRRSCLSNTLRVSGCTVFGWTARMIAQKALLLVTDHVRLQHLFPALRARHYERHGFLSIPRT